MTAKKRWLNKIYHDSQDQLNRTQVDISWSSSESEDGMQELRHPKKRIRIDAVNNWIKSNTEEKICWNHFVNITSGSDFQSPYSNHKEEISFPTCKPNSCKIMQKPDCMEKCEISVSSSTYNTHFRLESPVMNRLKLEELSPVLVQNPENTDATDQVSPILGKRSILENIRLKYKNKEHKVKQQVFKPSSSPNLFESPSSQVIESNSPDLCNKNYCSTIINESQSTACIDPFPSQYSSQIINSDFDNSLIKSDSSSLYHVPPPRKKKYKKGGVASLLQKALHLQRTRLSIWQHEIFTDKLQNLIDINEDEIIKFTIKEEWKEYGSNLLKCEAGNFMETKDSDSDLFNSTANNSFFLIIIGFSTTLNIVYTTYSKYKLFPPYSVKYVSYKYEKVPCYFNVTKILRCNE